MATKTWASTGSTSWNTAANWSPSGVPGSGDDVVFDATSAVNCTLDVNTDSLGYITLTGYTGTFSASSYNVTCTDVTNGSSSTISAGSGYWTCSGNVNINPGGFTLGTATLEMTGASKVLTLKTNREWYDLIISGSVSAGSESGGIAANTCEVSGSFSISGSWTSGTTATLGVGTGGAITGSGLITVSGVTQNDGSIACGTLSISVEGVGSGGTLNIASGTYSCDVILYGAPSSRTYLFESDVVFNGDFSVVSDLGDAVVLDFTTNDSNLTFAGNVAINVSSATWNKGAGTITISGSASQSIDFNDYSIEDIEIDKTAGTATLTGGVTTDSLTLTAGTLDVNSQSLDTVGNFTQAAGTTVTE